MGGDKSGKKTQKESRLSTFSATTDSPGPDWRWLQLRAQLVAGQGDQLRQRLRTTDAAELWQCSPKTARRTLQRWETMGRCRYLPGQGRGQLSSIVFARLAETEVRELTEALIQAGQLDDWSQLNALGFPAHWTRPTEVQRLFGLHSDDQGQDRLRLLIHRKLTTLDPLHSWVTFESWLLHQVFDGLTSQEADQPLQPALAHHWAVSADGREWHFHLRKGVRFHHGRQLTTDDLLFTLGRVCQEAPWTLPDLMDVKALDDLTLQLQLRRPDPLLLRRLAKTPFLVQPFDAPVDPATPRLCGTGAFRFSTFPAGFRLSAFENYYAGRPLLDEAELFFAPPASPRRRVELLGSGEDEPAPRTEVEKGVLFLIWNSHRAASHDLALRRAVAELHDPRAFWLETGRPEHLLATSFYPEFSAQRPVRNRSLERARRWLEEVPRPIPELTLYALPYPEARANAEWLAARARKLDLNIRVKLFDLQDQAQLADRADLVTMGEVASADTGLSFWTAIHSPQLIFRQLLPANLLKEVAADLTPLGQDGSDEAAAIAVAEARLQDSGWLNLTHHRRKELTVSAGLDRIATDLYGGLNLRNLWVNRWPLQQSQGNSGKLAYPS